MALSFAIDQPAACWPDSNHGNTEFTVLLNNNLFQLKLVVLVGSFLSNQL